MKRVVAAVIEYGGKVLIARRKCSSGLGGKWEFPGGTIEPGETPEQCLARELQEELGIEPEVGEFIARSRVATNDLRLELLAFRVRSFKGEARASVHDELRWVEPRDLSSFDLAEADRQILPMVLGSVAKPGRGLP